MLPDRVPAYRRDPAAAASRTLSAVLQRKRIQQDIRPADESDQPGTPVRDRHTDPACPRCRRSVRCLPGKRRNPLPFGETVSLRPAGSDAQSASLWRCPPLAGFSGRNDGARHDRPCRHLRRLPVERFLFLCGSAAGLCTGSIRNRVCGTPC